MTNKDVKITHEVEKEIDFLDFEGFGFEKLSDKKYLGLFIVQKIANGEINITEDFAKKIKKIIPKLPHTFWLSMQKHYDETHKKDQD